MAADDHASLGSQLLPQDLLLSPMKLSDKALGKMKAVAICDEAIASPNIVDNSGSHGEALDGMDSDQIPSHSGSADKDSSPFEGAGKYLLAGGIAGMVSRTATAPFDRLKIYLITSEKPLSIQPDHSRSSVPSPSLMTLSASRTTIVLQPDQPLHRIIPKSSNLLIAIKLIYQEPAGNRPGAGGLRNFFVGNGLNILKIFPESAIKFLTYEYIKMALGRGCYGLPPATDAKGELSNRARFLAGGLGGVVSQFAIYPIETLSEFSHPVSIMRLRSSTTQDPGLLVPSSDSRRKRGLSDHVDPHSSWPAFSKVALKLNIHSA